VHKIPFEKGSTVCFFTEPSASLFSGKSIVTLRRVPSSRLTSVIVLMKEYWQWRRYDYFNENASSWRWLLLENVDSINERVMLF